MTEVRWTTQAADDLQAIYDFSARDSVRRFQNIFRLFGDVETTGDSCDMSIRVCDFNL